jgi:hypothetical protein
MTQKIFHLLDQATQAMDTNNYPALARVSAPIAKLVPDNPYLAAPLLVIGQKLGDRENYLDAALKAVEVAADHAPRGSQLAQEAVDTLARLADALPEAMRLPTPQEAAQRFVDRFKLTL